jgi:hypothetical protein
MGESGTSTKGGCRQRTRKVGVPLSPSFISQLVVV